MLLKGRITRAQRPSVTLVSLPSALLADEALAKGDLAEAIRHVEQAYAIFDNALEEWERCRDVTLPAVAEGGRQSGNGSVPDELPRRAGLFP